jgi:serine/threonine protein kinase
MDILPQLLDALSEIHQYKIWHLDIKPANIMLVDNNVVLIDFGASKQITPSEMTSTALYFTPGYAPAEQTGMLFKQFGPWTDLYAVGATIFNLLTGKSPLEFDIEEFKEDDLPESNLGLMYKLINWMMQPKRKDRPQKAEDVKQKYYVDFVSIGVISIANEVLNKEIVKNNSKFIKHKRIMQELTIEIKSLKDQLKYNNDLLKIKNKENHQLEQNINEIKSRIEKGEFILKNGGNFDENDENFYENNPDENRIEDYDNRDDDENYNMNVGYDNNNDESYEN